MLQKNWSELIKPTKMEVNVDESNGRVGKLIAEEAIQLHGGIAMTWEYSVAHYAKRLIMIDHLMGDADYHRDRFKLLSLN